MKSFLRYIGGPLLLLLAGLAAGAPAVAYDGNEACGGVNSGTWKTCNDIAAASTTSVKDAVYGAKGDALTFTGCVMAASSSTFNISGLPTGVSLTAADVGKRLQCDGALGNKQPPVSGTILTVTSATSGTLSASATHLSGSSYLAAWTAVTAAASGDYVPGDTLTAVSGSLGTGGAATSTVVATGVYSATVAAGGSGATGSTCTLQTTTGVGSPAVIRFSVSAGAITGSGTIVSGGDYLTNPTLLTNEPLTIYVPKVPSCGITGAAAAIHMGVAVALPNAPGDYLDGGRPANPIATTGGSGAGATFNATWVATGTGIYGTDDTPAFTLAVNAANTNFAAGIRKSLYIPGGTYLINGAAIPTCAWSCSYVGDPYLISTIAIGADYAGTEILGYHNAWGQSDSPQYGGVLGISQENGFPSVANLSFTANRFAATHVNAIQFWGRTDWSRITNINCYYVGSCIRTGELLGGDTVSYTRESQWSFINVFNSGTATQPAIFITAQGATTGGSPFQIDQVRIFGSQGDGFVLQNEATNADLRSVYIHGLIIEGTARDQLANKGDLFRIGIASNTNATVSDVYVSGLLLTNPYPKQSGTSYCGLRLTGSSATNSPNNINITLADDKRGSTGGNGICIDAAYDSRLDFSLITSWIYDITIGSSTNVGSNIQFDLHNKAALLKWSIDPTSVASISTPLTAAGDPSSLSNYLTVAQALNFTGGLQVGGATMTLPMPLSSLATQAANTVVANVTSGSAAPTAAAMPSCADTAGSHLNYVSGTGFTCGTSGAPIITTYASGTGTHTFNVNAKLIRVTGIGGGGGGGGGYGGVTGSGGGGGGGAAVFDTGFLPAASFGASGAYVVGAGGSGGASATDGTAGGNTTFQPAVLGAISNTAGGGGRGGAGGSVVAAGGGGGGDSSGVGNDATGATAGTINNLGGGAGSTSSTATAVTAHWAGGGGGGDASGAVGSVDARTVLGATGGSGGGGIAAGTTFAGGLSRAHAGAGTGNIAGGTAGGVTGGSGNFGVVSPLGSGSGGSGGGSGTTTGGVGGAGIAGGGGGGAGAGTVAGGVGGRGGDGSVTVTETF